MKLEINFHDAKARGLGKQQKVAIGVLVRNSVTQLVEEAVTC
jgi:hypothetical protein